MLSYRNASIYSLAASFCLQTFIVIIQNQKLGFKKTLKEILIVLFGLKAPWDAYRVAIGAEQEKDALMDPFLEMTCVKCSELFTESIPGIIIQLSAMLSALEAGDAISTMAYVSLLVSMLSTGFISGTLSYDFDTDPKKRAFNPEFYGFVPDDPSSRALLFVTLILLSSAQVIMKSALVVVLALISKLYVILYISGDMIFYLLAKTVRNDFTYFLPVDGKVGLCVSFMCRVVMKFVGDFTGCIQFRHPYDTGGLVFTMNMFSPTVCFFLVLNLMSEGAYKEGTVRILSSCVTGLGVSILLLFGTLLTAMNANQRATFFSVETGSQLTRRLFLEGDDVMRADVFTNNKSHWYPIRREIMQWLEEGWDKWGAERPDWCSNKWKDSIPRDMLPNKIKRRGLFEKESEVKFESGKWKIGLEGVKVMPEE